MRISVILEALTGKFEDDLKRASRTAEQRVDDIKKSAVRLGRDLGVALAAAGTAVAALTKRQLDAADALSKLSQSTGVSVEFLSGLELAADLAGVSTEGLAGAMSRLARSASEAAQGGKTQLEAFKALGVSVRNADGSLKGIDTLLLDVADAFAGIEDGTAKGALAMELFGRSGLALVPFLNQGSEGINDVREEAARLGLVLDTETAQAAERFNDDLTRLQRAADGLFRKVAADLLPMMEAYSRLMVSSAEHTGRLDEATRVLANGVRLLASGGIIVVSVFDTLGKAFGAIAAMSQNWFTVLRNGGPVLAAFTKEGREAYRNIANISGNFLDDARSNITDALERLDSVWDDGLSGVEKRVEKTDKKLKRTLVFGTDEGAGAGEGSKAVENTTNKIADLIAQLEREASTLGMSTEQVKLHELALLGADDATQAYARSLLERIDLHARDVEALREAIAAEEEQREAQKRAAEELDAMYARNIEVITGVDDRTRRYMETLDELETLLDAGRISQDEFNAAIDRAKTSFEDSSDDAKNWAKTLEEMSLEAARNIQDAFADFLFDPFSQGLDGMFDQFANLLRRMAAEALAQQIFKNLFGEGGLGSVLGGVFGSVFGTSSTPSGGGRAQGGPVTPGVKYNILEQGEPEIFIPAVPGKVVPLVQSEPSTRGVTQVFNITAPDPNAFRSSERQIARRQRQALRA